MGSSSAMTADRVARYESHRPAAPLRPYVRSVMGYELRGFEPGIHRGLPSRHLTVVVSLDEALDVVVMPDPRQPPAAFAAIAGGLHTSPVSIRHRGSQHGIQLGLTPLGARHLFGMPAAELARAVVPLDDVLDPASELVERLSRARSWSARLAIVDDVLIGALTTAGRGSPRAEVAFAFDRLVDAAGTVDVAALAREVGWSRRHLTQQFRREYGVAPKAMARVLRFERAQTMVSRPERPSLAAVAFTCGYADQAHMTREWAQLAGASPGAWLAAEVLPFAPHLNDVAV